jgi:hypothetical protein
MSKIKNWTIFWGGKYNKQELYMHEVIIKLEFLELHIYELIPTAWLI